LPLDFAVAPVHFAVPAGVLATTPPDPALAGDERAGNAVPVDPVYEWADPVAPVIGTVVHGLLAQIAVDGPAAWPTARVDRLGSRIDAELRSAGVPASALPAARLRVHTAVSNSLDDERGRWLLDHLHEQAASEWALSAATTDGVEHLVLDRSFVADGVRWIVDFKTSRHEGGGLAAFLDRERQRHAPQLARYARAVAQLDARPLRLALYFPMLREWVLVDAPPGIAEQGGFPL
jgi:ATP-dependent exoDNAse (exonuclease V) beta subunit